VINHAAKFRWMYNDQVRTPLVIRVPMGGRRGYGPTHSQTLEKLFLGVPGLRVLAPSVIGNPGDLLACAILIGDDPTLFVENKLLYLLPVQKKTDLVDFELNTVPLDGRGVGQKGIGVTYLLTVRGAPPPVLTLASYGYMAELARQAMLKLAYEYEVFTELVIPTQLAPFEIEPILASVRRTGRLLTIEEGSLSLGWGAEIVARTVEALGAGLQAARRLAALDLPVPASGPLESTVLPSLENLVEIAIKMVL
jgi:pyruvate/2-oxoglutarate/acetoin dehydrogenase E1 component